MNITPYTDELWLKIIELLSNIKVVKSSQSILNVHLYRLLKTKSLQLSNINVGEGLNDMQLKNLLEKIPSCIAKVSI